MDKLQNNVIELLKKEETRGDIKVNIDRETSEIAVFSMYADYYIITSNQGYKLTYYRYKWDNEADQMESWPYEEGAQVSNSLLELVELIIDDLRD